MGTSISVKQQDERSGHPISSGDESWFPVFNWRGKPPFHKHLKKSFPLEICMWVGPYVLFFKWNGPRVAVIRKKSKFLQRLHACSSFISQDESMSESPVETQQKALGLHFISKWVLTCLWQLERHGEFTASNFDDAWHFFNTVRNPNITVSNRKRDRNSHLTSRSVRIVLPPIVYIPEMSLIPRQVFWLHWTNSSFEWTSHSNSRIYPRFRPQLEKTNETFPSLRDEARFPCTVSRAIAFSQSNT